MENSQLESDFVDSQNPQNVQNVQRQSVPSSIKMVPVTENPQDTEKQVVLASLVVRYAASLLDGLIVGLVLLIVSTLVMATGFSQNRLVVSLIEVFISSGYSVYFIKTHQATPGKKYFKLRVETIDSGQISWGRAFVREVLGKFLSSLVLGIGYLWAVFDKNKQAWHDKIAKTIVVQVEPLSKSRKFFAYFIGFGLIIIAILGVLAVVVLTSINPSEQLARTRDAGRVAAVSQIGHSVEAYYLSNKAYPSSIAWTKDLVRTGGLVEIPTEINYSNGDACGAPNSYQGWCYKGYFDENAIVYATLESKQNISKCKNLEKAYVVFLVKNGGRGVSGTWCGLSEPELDDEFSLLQ